MEATVVRTGRLFIKANKTDPVFQDFLMRQWSDGTVEQYLSGQRWVVYQGQFADQIKWES